VESTNQKIKIKWKLGFFKPNQTTISVESSLVVLTKKKKKKKPSSSSRGESMVFYTKNVDKKISSLKRDSFSQKHKKIDLILT
jgi:hypothetical protein